MPKVKERLPSALHGTREESEDEVVPIHIEAYDQPSSLSDNGGVADEDIVSRRRDSGSSEDVFGHRGRGSDGFVGNGKELDQTTYVPRNQTSQEYRTCEETFSASGLQESVEPKSPLRKRKPRQRVLRSTGRRAVVSLSESMKVAWMIADRHLSSEHGEGQTCIAIRPVPSEEEAGKETVRESDHHSGEMDKGTPTGRGHPYFFPTDTQTSGTSSWNGQQEVSRSFSGEALRVDSDTRISPGPSTPLAFHPPGRGLEAPEIRVHAPSSSNISIPYAPDQTMTVTSVNEVTLDQFHQDTPTVQAPTVNAPEESRRLPIPLHEHHRRRKRVIQKSRRVIFRRPVLKLIFGREIADVVSSALQSSHL